MKARANRKRREGKRREEKRREEKGREEKRREIEEEKGRKGEEKFKKKPRYGIYICLDYVWIISMEKVYGMVWD